MPKKSQQQQLKRISVLVREDQFDKLHELELNTSGLIRDLIDDHFSEHRVVLSVSSETKKIYQLLISNTGSSDKELEHHLRTSMKKLLHAKIAQMQSLAESL